jgi:hypothetical protein
LILEEFSFLNSLMYSWQIFSAFCFCNSF